MNLFKNNYAVVGFLIFVSFPLLAKEVVVIGTLHGDHNRFPLYNFETLRIVLDHIKPEIIFIEEDPVTFAQKNIENMSEEEYGKNRPVEIKKVLMPFAKKSGAEIVPTDWRVKYDKEYQTYWSKVDENSSLFRGIQHSYLSIFLDNYLTASIFDLHSDQVMAVLEGRDLIFDSIPEYRKMRTLDVERQNYINSNIIAAIKKRRFKVGVVVYGISHRPAIVRAIQNSKSAKIIDLRSAMAPKIPKLFDRDINSPYNTNR